MRGVLWEIAMKVFNATARVVVVRTFAAGVITPKLESVLILPGREIEVFGPILSDYGLRLPYKMDGRVLIRDWARPWVCWLEKAVEAEVVIREGEASRYKQPFDLERNKFEGFEAAFCDECHLVLI